MRSTSKNKSKSNWLNRISTLETIILAVTALLINFYIEETFWQTLTCALIGTGVFYFVSNREAKISQKFKSLVRKYGTMRLLGLSFFIILCGCSVISPEPAHAILFKAEAAVIKGITDNVADADVAKLMTGFVSTVLWIIRAGLLGILGYMCLKANEERQQDEAITKWIRQPAMFILALLEFPW